MNHAYDRRLLTGALAAMLGAALLAGCAGPDLDAGVAAQLQQRVATAKGHAAQQEFDAALAELAQLSQEVTTAAGRGQLSEPRKARIEAAIGSIRSDLEAAAAPAPQPSATSPAPLTEEQQEQLEEAQKEAEEQREKARKEAEEQLKEAQEEAEKQREEAQKEAEKQRGNG